MRQTILAAAVAFVVGGIATGAVVSSAQPPAPPAQMMAGGPPPPPPHPWMGWGHRGGPGMAGHGMHGAGMGGPVSGMRAFALVFRQQDRALSPADVQKIAEAFLLWNGNHTWKVADVAAASDGLVGFSMTTADGALIAKFTMDPHTARIVRVG